MSNISFLMSNCLIIFSQRIHSPKMKTTNKNLQSNFPFIDSTGKGINFNFHFFSNSFFLKILPFTVLAGGLLVVGCNQEGRGFALPDGNVDSGKIAFVQLGCNECHSVGEIPHEPGPENINVTLGGEVTKVKSYGDLVTSIINPSHKIAKRRLQKTSTDDGASKMKNYNEIMTVQELVDVVTFLQSEYKLTTPREYYAPY